MLNQFEALRNIILNFLTLSRIYEPPNEALNMCARSVESDCFRKSVSIT